MLIVNKLYLLGANNGEIINKTSTINTKTNFGVNKGINPTNNLKINNEAKPTTINPKLNLINKTSNNVNYSATNLGKSGNLAINKEFKQNKEATIKPILKNPSEDSSYGGVQGGPNLASAGASPVKPAPSYPTISSPTPAPQLNNPPVPSLTQTSENYANEAVKDGAAQTSNPALTPSTLYPSVPPSVEHSPPTPSPSTTLTYIQPQANPQPNYNPPQYASPPAISPYQAKAELVPSAISVPSRDAYEASVLEQTVRVITTTNIIPTTETTTTTIRTTTRVPPCGPDVLFVLDSTGSVRHVYEAQRSYILDVVQQMDIAPDGQHVGLIIYSSKLRQRIVTNLDESLTKEQFLKIVHELPYHGGITATGAALSLTIRALEKRRPNKRTLVIVFTDGFTYDDWEEPSRALLSKGVEVLVAGDVQSYLRPVLDKIAGDPAKVLLGAENKSKVLDHLRCR
uniref:VWFA domain-containing protein n=1 Tax=Meloidogyne hapla TaxID=6305 RepID=A0A1I8C007_MELHA